jgi:hypothetical protein
VKLVIENLIGNRLVIEQAEEIEELRLIVEQWVHENRPGETCVKPRSRRMSGLAVPGALDSRLPHSPN